MSDPQWRIAESVSGTRLDLWRDETVVGIYRGGHVQMLRPTEVPREVMAEFLCAGEDWDNGR